MGNDCLSQLPMGSELLQSPGIYRNAGEYIFLCKPGNRPAAYRCAGIYLEATGYHLSESSSCTYNFTLDKSLRSGCGAWDGFIGRSNRSAKRDHEIFWRRGVYG